MRLRGAARFTPCAAGLLFEEQGLTAFGSYRGEASRRLVFRFPSAGEAEVCFEDGTPFHVLDLREGAAQVRHECAPDLYIGRYRVLGPDRWTLGWHITGPRKRQLVTSRFSRIGAAG